MDTTWINTAPIYPVESISELSQMTLAIGVDHDNYYDYAVPKRVEKAYSSSVLDHLSNDTKQYLRFKQILVYKLQGKAVVIAKYANLKSGGISIHTILESPYISGGVAVMLEYLLNVCALQGRTPMLSMYPETNKMVRALTRMGFKPEKIKKSSSVALSMMAEFDSGKGRQGGGFVGQQARPSSELTGRYVLTPADTTQWIKVGDLWKWNNGATARGEEQTYASGP